MSRRDQIVLRDRTCVFPWCTRPARTACDHDHAIPRAMGGSTCTCNIAALCRHHHRLKTHSAWRYKMPEPGVFIWTSPHGYVFLRGLLPRETVLADGSYLTTVYPSDKDRRHRTGGVERCQ